MTSPSFALRDLGWSPFFQSQLEIDEIGRLAPVRVAAVHRGAADLVTPDGPRRAGIPAALAGEEIAVGDWLLADGPQGPPVRLLERKSVLHRWAAGSGRAVQVIAANLDTLFIVSSCNADFNVARLERYLVLARQSGVIPVVVLTRADTCADPDAWLDRVRAVAPDVAAEALSALEPAAAERLLPWCGAGETVALVGSSGVGKSTLISTLTGGALATRGIREDDAKGRHTTTARSMHPLPAGGWLVDTPGMRALRLYDAEDGVAAVFHDIEALSERCRFGDCSHETEPGCAVRAAITSGELDAARLARWGKLRREEAHNTASIAEQRSASKALGRFYRSVKSETKSRKGR